LAEALKTTTALATLNLSYSKIRDDGAVALAEALKINIVMVNIDLGSGETRLHRSQASWPREDVNSFVAISK
jgi:hypothetical protein